MYGIFFARLATCNAVNRLHDLNHAFYSLTVKTEKGHVHIPCSTRTISSAECYINGAITFSIHQPTSHADHNLQNLWDLDKKTLLGNISHRRKTQSLLLTDKRDPDFSVAVKSGFQSTLRINPMPQRAR